ncbi:serine protease [Sphingopyxis sp. KK2]|uniref:S1 family peptidase n=1 Tax=Sphingopyxis sp. KK2 TaxID=1855727 RepID=UPI0009FAF460|nr:serine protease [Sphingopyxis sp. KK2]
MTTNEDSKDQIGLLKSIWRQNGEGTWIVCGAKGLDLKPRQGFSDRYFKIEDELSLLTDKPDSVENLFTTFGTTEFLVRQSIVPVIAWSDGDDEIKCIGTGFFISATGLLLTAAHVVRDPIDEGYAYENKIDSKTSKLSENLHFGIILPANPAMRNAPFGNISQKIREAECFICPFEWTQHWGRDIESPLFDRKPTFKLNLDIAICKVRSFAEIGPYQPLNVGLHSLKVGDRAVAIGYAEMKNIRIGSFEQPELVVSVGSVSTIYPDNMTEKQNSTPGPNFEFNAKIPGKMSGSPILVGSGIIAKGVVSRSWQDEEHASGCLIAAMMGLPIVGEKTLLDLQRAGNDGIARVSGADL